MLIGIVVLFAPGTSTPGYPLSQLNGLLAEFVPWNPGAKAYGTPDQYVMPIGTYVMLNEPRNTTLLDGFHANPTLGPKLCQSWFFSKLSLPPLAYTTAPLIPRLGSIVSKSKFAQCPYFSCSRKLTTHRTPRLSVSLDRKSTRLNSSHLVISYAVF